MFARSFTRSTSGGSVRWTLSRGVGDPAGSPTSSVLGSLRWPVPVPTRSGVPATRWSLRRLACYLREQQIVEVSPAHLGRILADAGLSFQRTRTWKASPDPDYEAKAARVIALYKAALDGGVVVSFDQMGPISLRPHAGAGWARRKRPERQRATFTRRHGVRYVFGAYDVHGDRLRVRLRPSRSSSRSARATPDGCGSTGSRTTSRRTGLPTFATTPPRATSSSCPPRPTPAT